jgi:hypothetical protein
MSSVRFNSLLHDRRIFLILSSRLLSREMLHWIRNGLHILYGQ